MVRTPSLNHAWSNYFYIEMYYAWSNFSIEMNNDFGLIFILVNSKTHMMEQKFKVNVLSNNHDLR